jgi:heme/copper-type cytochrome/quinol oxidase subunit 3
LVTLALGILFVFLQFEGFDQLFKRLGTVGGSGSITNSFYML